MKENTLLSVSRSRLLDSHRKHFWFMRESFFFLSLVLLMLFAACTQETLFMEEEHEIAGSENGYLNPELQPFAAWLRSSTPG